MIEIDPDRLLTDLKELRRFGAQGTGVVRPSLSSTDMDARRWLRRRMAEAGLDAAIDGVGNVVGRSPRTGPALLIGSHSDTQPTGGWLDGALGVIYGLEVARACLESEIPAGGLGSPAVDAVAWIDEEGTFGSCLGSRLFCGLVDDAERDAATSVEGIRLVDAWDQAGLDGQADGPEPGRYRGYVEAHIEQGATLEAAGNRIGVVTSIVGSRTYRVGFVGQQNHAGTTPMDRRRDAGKALVVLANDIDQAFAAAAGSRTVWTIGRIELYPGASSIIPGRAEMTLQFRDPDPDRLSRYDEILSELVARSSVAGIEVTAELASSPVEPTAMDEGLQAHLAGAAEQFAPGQWVSMPSAAVHDAMFVASVMPAAMLFVPSIDGISHDAAEDTSDDDIVLGCRVLANAVAAILAEA